MTRAAVCGVGWRRCSPKHARKREMFGKVCMIKARPARTVVKAFPVSAFKQAI